VKLELSCLEGRWLHSWEEDSSGIRTYRPSVWPFPLSRRPRHILEFEPGQHVVSHVGGSSDSRIQHKGHWVAEAGESMLLRIEWDDMLQPTLIKINKCSEALLQVSVVDGYIE